MRRSINQLVSMLLFLLVATTHHTATSDELTQTAAMELMPSFLSAIRNGDADGMKRILADHREQVRARDKQGWTPLMYAAFYADATCVNMLLEQGANVDAVNNAGCTALHYAATNLKKTQLLIQAGANVNIASKRGNTPLMLAARDSDSAQIVRVLLDRGADVGAVAKGKTTALMVAAGADNFETVQLLLEAGAEPKLPRSFSKSSRTKEIATLLINAGADVNKRTSWADPLSIAAWKHQTALAKLLLEHGADIDAAASSESWTPLMWAAANERGDADLVNLLLKHGADANAGGGESWGPQMGVPHSPLMIARRRGKTEAVQALLTAGAVESEDPWARKQRFPKKRNVVASDVDTAMLVDTVKAAVPLLQRTAIETFGEFAAHEQNCISCHSQLLPLIAVSLAKEKGIASDSALIEKMVDVTKFDYFNYYEETKTAELTDANLTEVFHGYGLWALSSESVPPNFGIDAGVHEVAVAQSPDGSWTSVSPRPPIQDGIIGPTALAIRALTLYPLPGRQLEMDNCVTQARAWLEKAEPQTTEEYAYKLLGLHWAGVEADALVPVAAELSDLQRSDGGWAQLPGLDSDAYGTGQAVYALQAAGGQSSDDEVVSEGLAFLVRSQMDDGSWFVRRRAYPEQPTMDPKFPHGRDAWISATATSWAVMALTAGLDKQEVGNVLARKEQLAWTESHAEPEKELPPVAKVVIDYEKHILPILDTSCIGCHSSDDPAGKYAIDSRDALIKGGFSGPPVVIPGRSADSLLVHHVAGFIEDVEMPPLFHRDDYEPLTDEQIGLLRAWIDQGIPWSESVSSGKPPSQSERP